MKLEATGLDAVAEQLDKLGEQAASIAAQSLYVGAGVVADELAKIIDEIPEENFRILKDGEHLHSATPREKAAIKENMGIAKFTKNGTEVYTSIGITGSGYMSIKTKRYPKGIPIALVARSINSGSSVRQKYPFIRKAQQVAKTAGAKAITDKAQLLLKEIIKG